MMSEKEARAFITQVAPLGTMDYSLLHKRPPMIKTNYGFSWPVPPATLSNRDSSNNTINSRSSTWLLRISDEKNLQFGNGDNQENN